MPKPRILLVDDNDNVRSTLQAVLALHDFDVVAAANVNEALRYIGVQLFDVLLSDLHMPGRGDGLTVVSAMRHAHPRAVTLVYSGYPEMQEATAAILLQADQVLIKPLEIPALIKAIRDNLDKGTKQVLPTSESVATILEQDGAATIQDWLARVERNQELTNLTLTSEERTGHLPQLFKDLVIRLRQPQSLDGKKRVSAAARKHGKLRHRQGYAAAMLVEESRMLQVSIFQTLQNNLDKVNFSLLLLDVMAIADEVDSQLTQAMRSYMEQENLEIAA